MDSFARGTATPDAPCKNCYTRATQFDFGRNAS